MQFLCLHGAIGNKKNFSIQLAPLEQVLENDQAASFQYIDGPIEVNPPEGFKDYFGIGPHYRWMDDGGSAEDSLIQRIRQLPVGHHPEDVIRALRKGSDERGVQGFWRNHDEVLDYLYKVLDENPQIEGIIGYSEGSSMAGSLILDEMKRYQETGRPKRIKCAVFFTGWPPIAPDEKPLLSDESDVTIDIPTLHVIGASDPYRYGALALYNVCNSTNAEIFDTGKGHTIPRAGDVIPELGEAMREMIGGVA